MMPTSAENCSVLFVEDSFAWLKTAREACVDVVITDPPYSAHVHENMSSGTAMKRFVEGGGGGGIPRIVLPFEPLDSHLFARDLIRMARRWCLIFCAVEDFGEYRRAVPDNYVRGGIWYKPNSMGQLTGDRPAAAYEGISILHTDTKKAWNGRGSYAYWEAGDDSGEGTHFVCNGTRGEKERHPNQKPLNLCLELVAKFSNAGETVFDPFAGSGRIGEACALLGRKYIGLDNSQEWVDRANTRISAAPWASKQGADCLRLCAAPKRGA